MVCKFHAPMSHPTASHPATAAWRRWLAFALLGLAVSLAQAEKADRLKPLSVEADQPGKIDLLNQFVVFNGNVVVTKGTMRINAARIEEIGRAHV